MSYQCRICGCKSLEETYTVKEMMFGLKNQYRYEKCGSCNVIQIADLVTDVEKLYPSYYYSFNANDSKKNSAKTKFRKHIYSKVVAKELGHSNFIGYLLSKMNSSEYQNALDARSLRKIIRKNDRILDVGCGSGKLLEALKNLDYKQVSGIDPFISKDMSEPVTIYKKHLEELSNDNKYDVIMMHHSLEHMDNPLSIFRKVKDLLNEEGRAIIRIPVSDSYAFEKYQTNWYQLDAPRHIFLHTDKSINILSKEAGLKVTTSYSDSTFYQFVISEQYQMGIALSSDQSYCSSFSKEMNPFRKTLFSNKDIQRFKSLTNELNVQNQGDQRVYILTH